MVVKGNIDDLLKVIKAAVNQSPFNFGVALQEVNTGMFEVSEADFDILSQGLETTVDKLNDAFTSGGLVDLGGYFAYNLEKIDFHDGDYMFRINYIKDSLLESVIDIKVRINFSFVPSYKYSDLVVGIEGLGVVDYVDNILSDIENRGVELPKSKVDDICYKLSDRLTNLSTYNNSDGWCYYLMTVEAYKTVVNIIIFKGVGEVLACKKWSIKVRLTSG